MPALPKRMAGQPQDHVMEDLNEIDLAIQQLIAESERLIDQAQQLGFDKLCEEQGVDAQRLRQTLSGRMGHEASELARHETEADLADIRREVETEAQRRGLRPAPSKAGRRPRGLRI